MNRYKKQVMMRRTRCEESVWRTNQNYTVAQAHLVLFYQGLTQLHEGPLQYRFLINSHCMLQNRLQTVFCTINCICDGLVFMHSVHTFLSRYSQLDPLNFSMAHSGICLKMRNSQQQLPPKCDPVVVRDRRDVDIGEDEDGSSLHLEQHVEMQRQTVASMLDSLNKSALHLRRAMVLAHRGGHWAVLRSVCQTVWDQYCRTAKIVQRCVQLELPFFITTEQQHNIFTPLLVLATELIMDMLNMLRLWRVYEKEDVQPGLHFSPLDDTTKMDMHWVRTLVIHTLELLQNDDKWEKMAHLAILFNTYTQEHYASLVTPLLINAQRNLLERIQLLGGPEVPQPHHVRTQDVTGSKVTYKSYADMQLLSGWTQGMPLLKKDTKNHSALTYAEIQRSMVLVCVPLDVEDTLLWYRKALEKRSPCLQFFQHSHTLLLLLLANTQPYYTTDIQSVRSREPSRNVNLVEFNPTVLAAPNVKPCNLMEEDYSSPDSVYSLPISPEQIPTITAAYTTSVNYLHENRCESLRVVALHEMGDLQFYNGNTKESHSCWTRAVNCALKTQDAFEKWDGVTFAGCSLQKRLKLSGIWGCLQAACLTAKIAQYILTSDISKRTNCCLQSAHLFKCVLCCSLAQPQSELHYASDSVIDDLLPGVDLFSDPSRVHLGTTITSLDFICHWLFSTGYYVKLLPMLSLYFYFVGTLCRDVQRSVECKILKIRALTELGLFTEAVKEVVHLSKGTWIRLPHGHYFNKDKDHHELTFNSKKSVLDNIAALEELVNCDVTLGLCTLYGSTLCLRYNLARTQLILAICSTIGSPPQVPDTNSREVCEQNEQADVKPEQQKLLDLVSVGEQLTLGQIKYLLLESVSFLLNSTTKQLTAASCCHVEKVELTVEFKLLKAKLYLMKGQATLSSEMAASSLELLQSFAKTMAVSISVSWKTVSHLQQTGSEDDSNQSLLDGDLVELVEASEKTGWTLWIRSRLTLVHSLTAHNPGNGNNTKKETAKAIRDGVEECKKWGDPDSQASLMLEAAQWDSDKNKVDQSTLLNEIVSLLSERLNIPPPSVITLAQAAVLLSDIQEQESIPVLKLSQMLLQNQLRCFSQNIVLEDGQLCSRNICLPFLHLLHLSTSRIDQILGS